MQATKTTKAIVRSKVGLGAFCWLMVIGNGIKQLVNDLGQIDFQASLSTRCLVISETGIGLRQNLGLSGKKTTF